MKSITDSKDNENKKAIKFPINVKNVFPKHRQQVLNENGWGFRDCYFTFENDFLVLKGGRYEMCNKPLLNARASLLELLNADITNYKPTRNPVHNESDYPPRVENKTFYKELQNSKIEFSLNFDDRLLRCRGQASKDFYILRYGKFKRVPDIVVFPKSHEDVVMVVELAKKYCSVLVPYGGGTSTTMSLNYLKDEYERFFISLDTTQMNRILWFDKISMMACLEAGISGKDLEDNLQNHGLTLGHDPDSIELSTLGGWVATKSAGMKQLKYGNIEDMVKKITLVTSVGVLEKNFLVPRASIGPDFDCIALGSEGTLGVITKVVVKVHPKPTCKRYGTMVFPNFEKGVNFMHEVSKLTTRPTSIRVIDNVHYRFGFAFQHNRNFFGKFVDMINIFGGQILYRLDIKKISMTTYLIEGEKDEINEIESQVKRCGTIHGGIVIGAKYAERAYQLTMTNCYLRDLFFDLGFVFDSIEPSIVWKKCWSLIKAIEKSWKDEMDKRKILNVLAIRISQVYDTGACVYFYYGIGPTKDRDQFEVFEELTDTLRVVILNHGGCLSHHHGIGKKSLKYYPKAVSSIGVDVFNSIKKALDPQNIFDVGNFESDKNMTKM
ncbi:unnamed protein product [Chironomus riparius]|uniref:Alkylglycerone-phosphate synthase n=1 Tax=Chironomus riparius TaxID=315576 RepID=A0A9N9RQP1_9DIPT|nr:unnamed protein product [Chironomus riparius]